MSGNAARLTIPTPEMLVKAWLRRAPPWLQRFVSTVVAVLAWAGLPPSVLSTVSNLQWVIDSCAWLYLHAGALRPVLSMTGEGITFLVHYWKLLTHPFWHALFGWLHVTLPTWAPDALTVLILIAIGSLRSRSYRARHAKRAENDLNLARKNDPNAVDVPKAFGGEAFFERKGVKLTESRRRNIERLWPAFRQSAGARRHSVFEYITSSGDPGRFKADHLYAQFYKYWRASVGARRIVFVYGFAVALIAAALVIEWARASGLQ